MAHILDRLDLDSVDNTNVVSTPQPQDDMPVPRSFLQRQPQSDATKEHVDMHPMMDQLQCFSPPNSPVKARHDHASDSGLGSSIGNSQGVTSEKGKGMYKK